MFGSIDFFRNPTATLHQSRKFKLLTETLVKDTMKNIFLLVYFIFFAFNVNAQTKPDTIHWKRSYKLRPQDFLGDVESNSRYKAITVSGIEYSSFYDTDTSLKFNVFAIFHKKDSWIVNKKDSSYILQHEQGHFDITEIFSRLLYQRLKEIENKNYSKNKILLNDRITQIVEKTVKQKNIFDMAYDSETKNSLESRQQIKWLKKIENLLLKNVIDDNDIIIP